MGSAVRTYFHLVDGRLRAVSQRLAADLRSGRAALQEFAGSAQQVIVVLLEFENRRPQRVLDVQGQVWRFDDEGRAAGSMWREHCARVELLPGAFGSLPPGVADARPAIARKKLDAASRWTVPSELLDRIVADLSGQ